MTTDWHDFNQKWPYLKGDVGVGNSIWNENSNNWSQLEEGHTHADVSENSNNGDCLFCEYSYGWAFNTNICLKQWR